MVTLNDNSFIQDRNGSKTNEQDGLQGDDREDKKSRGITKERWENWEGGILKEGVIKEGKREEGRVERSFWEEKGGREWRKGGKKRRKEKTWELWEREAGGAVSDAKGWDGICLKVGAKANVQLSRTFVLFKNIF